MRGRMGVPNISDRVVLGLNSTMVGGISVENDALLAINSFVNFDVVIIQLYLEILVSLSIGRMWGKIIYWVIIKCSNKNDM